MDRTVASTLLHIIRLRLLQDYPAQIDACLDVLDDEQLWWRPNEQSNAVGNLLVHLAGSNRYYLEHVLAGRELSRDRDAEFAERAGRSKVQVRHIWDGALRVSTEILAGLDPDRLMDTTDRSGKPTTLAQILLHVSHHNAMHTGQILWITKMLHPGVMDDVGRKMRAR